MQPQKKLKSQIAQSILQRKGFIPMVHTALGLRIFKRFGADSILRSSKSLKLFKRSFQRDS